MYWALLRVHYAKCKLCPEVGADDATGGKGSKSPINDNPNFSDIHSLSVFYFRNLYKELTFLGSCKGNDASQAMVLPSSPSYKP